MALSICAARSTRRRETGARQGAGADACKMTAPTEPGSRVCPRGSSVYSPPAQCMHGSVRGCGGAQEDGGSLARTHMGDRDGFMDRERSRIHWGNGLRRWFLRRWCAACVLRMLARPRGAPVRAGGAGASRNGRTQMSAAPHLLLAHAASNVCVEDE